MARKARKGRRRRRRGIGTFVSAAFAIIAVSISAVFLGYLVGHVAIRNITKPLVEELSGPEEPESLAPAASNERGQTVSPPNGGPGGRAESPRPSPLPPKTAAGPEDSSGATAAMAGLWRVHTGRFAAKAEAEAVLQEIRVYEPQAFVVYEGVYRIQVGAFKDRDRAAALAAELARRGLASEVIAP